MVPPGSFFKWWQLLIKNLSKAYLEIFKRIRPWLPAQGERDLLDGVEKNNNKNLFESWHICQVDDTKLANILVDRTWQPTCCRQGSNPPSPGSRRESSLWTQSHSCHHLIRYLIVYQKFANNHLWDARLLPEVQVSDHQVGLEEVLPQPTEFHQHSRSPVRKAGCE